MPHQLDLYGMRRAVQLIRCPVSSRSFAIRKDATQKLLAFPERSLVSAKSPEVAKFMRILVIALESFDGRRSATAAGVVALMSCM
jgi:hypothetical protein